MANEDHKALMSSEIFCEYLKNELLKQAAETEQLKVQAEKDEENKLENLERLSDLENKIKSSPKKLAAFKALQYKFATDPDYTAKVKKSFVDSIMMLDLLD